MRTTLQAAVAVISLWAGANGQAESVRLMTVECRPRFEMISSHPEMTDIDQPPSPTTQPKIDPNENYTHLVIGTDSGRAEITWSMTNEGKTHLLYPRLKLELDQSYSFTIEEVKRTLVELDPEVRPELRNEVIRTFNLVKVVRGEKVLFDRSVCEVHEMSMECRLAPVQYGEPAIDYPMDVFDQTFPHSREVVLGGCIPGHEKTGHLFVCPSCVEAYAKWKERKPKASQ